MKITAVDERNDLFAVEDILPESLIKEIQQENFLEYPYENNPGFPKRRFLTIEETSPLAKINAHLQTIYKDIELAINCKLRPYFLSGMWFDSEGVSVSPHLDNPGVDVSLQLYLLEGINEQWGTEFYENGKLRYQFLYRPNTGYIMINGPDQYHAGITKVFPADTYRLCSYTWFTQDK